MAKKGYYKCEKCGKQFAGKRSIAHHTCKPEAEKQAPQGLTTIKCLECGKDILSKNFNDHQKRCEATAFLENHRRFFKFFCRVIRRHNIALKREDDKLIRNNALDMVASCTIGKYDIPEEDEKLLNMAAERLERKKKDDEAIQEAIDLGIDLTKNIPMEVVKDTLKGLAPRYSARQIIIAYLKDNELYTPEIHKWLNISFGGKDYPTDYEIAVDPILYNQVNKLRGLSSYNDTYQRFYYMVSKYFNNNDSFECHFCNEYVFNPRDHIKNCSSFKNLWETDRDDTIVSFISIFYPSKLIDKDYYKSYYAESTQEYFLSTIAEHVKDKVTFQEKQEDEQKKLEPPKKEKWDVKAFVKEVDTWVGPDEKIPERYTIPFTYIDKEQNLLLKVPVIIEDIKQPQIYKIKDPQAPSILALQEPVDNKPKVVFDEKRGVMTFAEPPKPKQVEPPKEEVNEEEPLPDLPDDFNLFDYDILNNKK